MAEAGTATPPPAETTVPVPGAPSDPAAKPAGATPATPTIDPAEYERLRRNEERWKGDRAMLEPLIGAGIKDPDGIKGLLSSRDRAEKLSAFEKKTGMKFDAFMSSLDEPAAPAGSDEANEEERFKAYAQKLGLLSRDELARETAQKEYDKGWESFPNLVGESLTDEVVKELLGDGATDFQKAMLRKAIERDAVEHREALAENHPLKDLKHGPPTKASVDKVLAALREAKAKAAGADLDAAATEAAKRPKPSGTPAGSRAGQGTATQTPATDDPARRIAERASASSRRAGAAVG